MKKIVCAGLLFFLTGCMLTPPNCENFETKQIQTSYFSIAVWEKKGIKKGKPLRIYFEGDGNPNPQNAVAFDYAKQDPTDNVIYVARPCQWVKDKLCEQKPQIYTSARFHEEIMKEMEELTTYLVKKYQAPSVELIGYDGGAVVALNMSLKVPTSRIITIAGITDIVAYNTYHNITDMDMETTVNPTEDLIFLARIPQIHYVGKEDNVTPRRLVERFVSRMKNPKSAAVKVVPNVKHTNWRGVKLDY